MAPGFGNEGSEFFDEFQWGKDDVSGSVMKGVFQLVDNIAIFALFDASVEDVRNLGGV
jgi:hypothetical protein